MLQNLPIALSDNHSPIMLKIIPELSYYAQNYYQIQNCNPSKYFGGIFKYMTALLKL